MARTKPSAKEQELLEDILSFQHDPLGFVMYAFPWGQERTPLERMTGPRKWQRQELERLRDHLRLDRGRAAIGLPSRVYYSAISSGRGIGKSAMIAMMNYWIMSCWPGATAIVTANTETQLRSRTMAELGKWHTMSINSHWFEKSSMALRPQQWYAQLLNEQMKMDTQYYYCEGQSWSEENPDAFAGAHSMIGMCVTFDEASGVPEPIWNVTEGFFTDLAAVRIWFTISNPRRNTGAFYDAFNPLKGESFWNTRTIDSRTVEGLDNAVYDRIVKKHGEDSDVARTEVRGKFPKTGSSQFIGREMVMDAQLRELGHNDAEPLIMGVDVARFGDDDSVIRFRRGRDSRTYPIFRYKGLNTMELADKVAELINRFRPDGVNVDGGGVGGGVVDRLAQMRFRVNDVQFGAGAIDGEKYLNHRAECWGRMRDWLETGCLNDDMELLIDLTGPEYDYNGNKIKLESKKDMKKRGLKSPDDGDALSLTFSKNIARRDLPMSRHGRGRSAKSEYDEFA